jgi:hypothetical protein
VRRTDPAEPPNTPGRGSVTTTPRDGLGVCGVPSERSGCPPYPGFHPGLVFGAPLGHSESPSSPEPSCERRTDPAEPPNTPSGAGSVQSEHRNVLTLFPLARQRERPTCPHVPCERRTDPAEAPPPTSPRRQPHPSATAKQVRVPECLRRSFRTLRLSAIPGVSPRAGIRCPVGALRKLYPPPSLPASEGPIPRSPPKYAKRSGTGPKRALKAITKIPRAQRESSILPRAFLRAQDRSRGAHQQPPTSPERPGQSL